MEELSHGPKGQSGTSAGDASQTYDLDETDGDDPRRADRRRHLPRVSVAALTGVLLVGLVLGALGMRSWDADQTRIAGNSQMSVDAVVTQDASPGDGYGASGFSFTGTVSVVNRGPRPIVLSGMHDEERAFALRWFQTTPRSIPAGEQSLFTVSVAVFSCRPGLPVAAPLSMTVRTADGRSRQATTPLSLANTSWDVYIRTFCTRLEQSP